MRGPTTPVCRKGQPCSEPASGAQLVFTSQETPGVQFTTTVGKDGSYTVDLPPDLYTVTVSRPPSIGRGIEPSTVRVTVRERTVDFSIDTGIR